MRIAFVAILFALAAQAAAKPSQGSSESQELFVATEKAHLITIVYCTSCGCYLRNSNRIAEEIQKRLPDQLFETNLIPRQGYFDIYVTKAGTAEKVIVWSHATKMMGTGKFPDTESLIPAILNVIGVKK